MPEGPEVRIIATNLCQEFEGGVLLEALRLEKKHDIIPSELLPTSITKISCKGKKIIFVTPEFYIASSLGMEGKWCLTEQPHTNYIFTIKDLQGRIRKLYYADFRYFGEIHVGRDLETYLMGLGHDLMSISLGEISFPINDWVNMFNRKVRVGALLLEQYPFAGIGNYLRSEILYRSGIHPFRKANELSIEEVYRLAQCTLDTFYHSWSCGGLTLKSFWSIYGEKGMYPCCVYGKEKDPNGYKVLKEKLGGRSVYYVTEVQK